MMVGLKYERLPKFCYACGRVGHGINECPDMEAKKEAMEGLALRFGSWMRAPLSKKSKDKSSSQVSGGSSVRNRLLRSSHELGKNGASALEAAPFASQEREPTITASVSLKKVAKKPPKTLGVGRMKGQVVLDKICVDGPSIGLPRVALDKSHIGWESSSVYSYGGVVLSAGLPRAMIGLSWNVWCIGNPRMFAALKRLFKKHSPDLVFLSKTKLGGSCVGKIWNLLGFGSGFSVDSIGKSGGLLLL
ncbi:hypothetical protein EZV62_022244 [Acer yangbiense]|uniref:CCHC-type domain-containing protein n=1 Tax=Acer yangbiense TaxID=1000413 RepID=A0A5C7H9C1_9ROSI|nr:hypothetical protein EZV62_022244 [Acer yangbiense]